MSAGPLVGVPADYRVLAGGGVHMVDDSYVRAIADAVHAIPIIIPALADRHDWDALLEGLDGLMLTGSTSNVAPARYGGGDSQPGAMHDLARDASNLPLIPKAVAAGVPLLAICRGFQELNVAYGGTLHQRLQELPGRIDHRAPAGQPVDMQFGAAHSVNLTENGMLHNLIGTGSVKVNSVHWQGIDRLGEGLKIEALADDGTVEAVRVEGAPEFALAVQWHPEHRPDENPVSMAIFTAFADAVGKRWRKRLAGGFGNGGR